MCPLIHHPRRSRPLHRTASATSPHFTKLPNPSTSATLPRKRRARSPMAGRNGALLTSPKRHAPHTRRARTYKPEFCAPSRCNISVTHFPNTSTCASTLATHAAPPCFPFSTKRAREIARDETSSREMMINAVIDETQPHMRPHSLLTTRSREIASAER